MGSWCSGITSASHAEGPGFKSQWVQTFRCPASRASYMSDYTNTIQVSDLHGPLCLRVRDVCFYRQAYTRQPPGCCQPSMRRRRRTRGRMKGGSSRTCSWQQRSLHTILIRVPANADCGQFCLLCCQPGPKEEEEEEGRRRRVGIARSK